MISSIRIEKVGDAAVLRLPDELLHHLGAQLGDTLELVEEPGGYRLTKIEPTDAAQMS